MVDKITAENANEVIFDFLEGNLSDNENQLVEGFAQENFWFQNNLNDFKAGYIFGNDKQANYPNHSKEIINNTITNSNKLLKFGSLAILICASGVGAWYFLQNGPSNSQPENPTILTKDSINIPSPAGKDTTRKISNSKNEKSTGKNQQDLTVKSFYEDIKREEIVHKSVSEQEKIEDSLVVQPVLVDTSYKIAPTVTNKPAIVTDSAIAITHTSKVVTERKLAKQKKKLNIKSNKVDRNNLMY